MGICNKNNPTCAVKVEANLQQHLSNDSVDADVYDEMQCNLVFEFFTI